jgi:hypothetical protein
MSDADKKARRGQLRNTALVALLIPAALLAGCAAPAPPPPPPQPVYAQVRAPWLRSGCPRLTGGGKLSI